MDLVKDFSDGKGGLVRQRVQKSDLPKASFWRALVLEIEIYVLPGLSSVLRFEE